jgi:hypothetical protein
MKEMERKGGSEEEGKRDARWFLRRLFLKMSQKCAQTEGNPCFILLRSFAMSFEIPARRTSIESELHDGEADKVHWPVSSNNLLWTILSFYEDSLFKDNESQWDIPSYTNSLSSIEVNANLLSQIILSTK